MNKSKRKYTISKEALEQRQLKSKQTWQKRRSDGDFDNKLVTMRIPLSVITHCEDNGFQVYKLLELILFGTLKLEDIRSLYTQKK